VDLPGDILPQIWTRIRDVGIDRAEEWICSHAGGAKCIGHGIHLARVSVLPARQETAIQVRRVVSVIVNEDQIGLSELEVGNDVRESISDGSNAGNVCGAKRMPGDGGTLFKVM